MPKFWRIRDANVNIKAITCLMLTRRIGLWRWKQVLNEFQCDLKGLWRTICERQPPGVSKMLISLTNEHHGRPRHAIGELQSLLAGTEAIFILQKVTVTGFFSAYHWGLSTVYLEDFHLPACSSETKRACVSKYKRSPERLRWQCSYISAHEGQSPCTEQRSSKANFDKVSARQSFSSIYQALHGCWMLAYVILNHNILSFRMKGAATKIDQNHPKLCHTRKC